MTRVKQLELGGFREACEDAAASLIRAQEVLDEAAIPDRERDALASWAMQIQYNAAGLANKAAAIDFDLRVA